MSSVPVVRHDSHDAFYRSYAIAMLTWQSVESSLFRMYFGLFTGGNLRQTGAAYFSVESFGAKLRLVSATAQVVLGERELGRWSKLQDRLLKASGERNRLAHLPASIEFQSDGSCSLVLTPNIFVPETLTKKRRTKYGASDCDRLATSFQDLSHEIDLFAEKVMPELAVD